MVKPRIVIADLDSEYIIPLQLKFVEDFYEKVDLEIITDENYYDELFSTPQKIDILIVSEHLYDYSLQRHNIGTIFMMTEHPDQEETGDLSVNHIYKYTSIKEIFNEISGNSSNVLDVASNEKKETQIILVYSASGGVGKTTVALGLSESLTNNYKRVLYMNADHLQSFQRFLESSTPITTSDVYAKLTIPSETIYNDIKHAIRKEKFSYLPPFKAALMSLGLDYDIYKKIALSAKKTGDYDFVVIDADTAFDEDKANLINIADKVILVTSQTKQSVYATNILVSNMNGADTDKYLFVCNNFDNEEENALIFTTDLKFSVQEYIEHIPRYDSQNIKSLSQNKGIQKVTYLII